MKAFKGKTFVAPVEKERKELGKFKEKLDHKLFSSHRKISNNYKYQKSNLGSMPTNPKKGKKKLSYGDYILLGSLIGLSLLFVFLIITVVLVPSSEGNNNNNSNKTVHDEN